MAIKLENKNKNSQWKKGLNNYRSELGSIYYTYDTGHAFN